METYGSYETNWVKIFVRAEINDLFVFLLYRSRFREVADIPRSIPLIFEVSISV